MSNVLRLTRISQECFDSLGGLHNSQLFRVILRGQWAYFHRSGQ